MNNNNPEVKFRMDTMQKAIELHYKMHSPSLPKEGKDYIKKEIEFWRTKLNDSKGQKLNE